MAKPKDHPKRKCDHISRIAAEHHHSDWEPIWEANPELKKVRKNPQLLGPQDVLTIPPPEDDKDNESTETNTVYTAEKSKLFLRLAILKEDLTPLAKAPYVLTLGTEKREGETNEKGEIEEGNIPQDATTATLTARVPQESGDAPVTWELEIGELHPVLDEDSEWLSGVQQRLHNLGFHCGPANGQMTEATKTAIRAFRKKFQLKDSDRNDEELRRKIAEVHDNPNWKSE